MSSRQLTLFDVARRSRRLATTNNVAEESPAECPNSTTSNSTTSQSSSGTSSSGASAPVGSCSSQGLMLESSSSNSSELDISLTPLSPPCKPTNITFPKRAFLGVLGILILVGIPSLHG